MPGSTSQFDQAALVSELKELRRYGLRKCERKLPTLKAVAELLAPDSTAITAQLRAAITAGTQQMAELRGRAVIELLDAGSRHYQYLKMRRAEVRKILRISDSRLEKVEAELLDELADRLIDLTRRTREATDAHYRPDVPTHDDTYVRILHIYQAILVAIENRDYLAGVLQLDRLCATAMAEPPMRERIAQLIAELLRRADALGGQPPVKVQQSCIAVLAACFADGIPFALTHEQELLYPQTKRSFKEPGIASVPAILDLSGIFFLDVDFSGLRLCLVNFADATFVRCTFAGSYFESCDFSRTTFAACRLTSIHGIADLFFTEGNRPLSPGGQVKWAIEHINAHEEIPARNWHTMSCLFKFCLLNSTIFREVWASGACFWVCNLSNGQFGPEGWQMRHIDFSACDLTVASFRGMDLAESLFMSCDLRYTDFENCNLWMARIRSTMFKFANFRGTSMLHVDDLEMHKEGFLRETLYDESTTMPWQMD